MALINIGNDREAIQKLREDLHQRDDTIEFFQERIAELELAVEDQGWSRLGSKGKELDKSTLDKINDWARMYWLKNPLIRRAILTQTQYVFGQGIQIEAEHEEVNEVVQDFLEDQKNRDELTQQQALMQKETELQMFGNLFFVFFTDPSTGRVRVRTIPMDQIVDVMVDNEDFKTVQYYKRVFFKGNEQKIKYYPDWTNEDPLDEIEGYPVEKDTPIYHLAVNKLSDQKFGTSEIYGVMDWAKAYKNFLEDWATIVNAYSRFAWKVKTKGGQKSVNKVQKGLQSSYSTGLHKENNPAAAAGSTWIEGQGVSMEPFKASGPSTKAGDGNKMVHMISAGTGIFYHYLMGDPSTGNLATAKAMERPMEIMFKDRQTLWKSALGKIFQYVIDESVKAPKGKLGGAVIRNYYGDKVVELAKDTTSEDPEKRGKPMSKTVHITFPDLLEKDVTSRVEAIVSAATLNGKEPAGTLEDEQVTRMILDALNVENPDEIIQRMYAESSRKWSRQVKDELDKLAEAVKQINNDR
jgi:hypothetical protein